MFYGHNYSVPSVAVKCSLYERSMSNSMGLLRSLTMLTPFHWHSILGHYPLQAHVTRRLRYKYLKKISAAPRLHS